VERVQPATDLLAQRSLGFQWHSAPTRVSIERANGVKYAGMVICRRMFESLGFVSRSSCLRSHGVVIR
jgi:hypothetical protein